MVKRLMCMRATLYRSDLNSCVPTDFDETTKHSALAALMIVIGGRLGCDPTEAGLRVRSNSDSAGRGPAVSVPSLLVA